MKNGAPRDDPKNGRGRGWVVPYLESARKRPCKTNFRITS